MHLAYFHLLLIPAKKYHHILKAQIQGFFFFFVANFSWFKLCFIHRQRITTLFVKFKHKVLYIFFMANFSLFQLCIFTGKNCFTNESTKKLATKCDITLYYYLCLPRAFYLIQQRQWRKAKLLFLAKFRKMLKLITKIQTLQLWSCYT